MADLIDRLMAQSWQERPKNTQEILRRLKEIKQPAYRWLLLKSLALGALALVGAGGIYGSYWYSNGVGGRSKIWLRRFPVGDKLSCGEEILVPGAALQNKQQGVRAFAAGDYRKAVYWLEKAWQQQHDPETLIYLNNARLMKQEAYAIAVAIPITNNRSKALEILRGGFYDSQSNYSQSLQKQFHKSFHASRGQVIEKFDLSDSLFNANAALDRVHQKGATAFVVLPNSQTSSKAFLNALKVIKTNQGRHWIVGGDSLYNSEILEMAGKDAMNRLLVAVPWHQSSSPNPNFPKEAKSLWRVELSCWCTPFAYDATRVLIAAIEKQQQPNRNAMQQALADPTFSANGATGEIRLRSGEPRQSNIQFVQVLPSKISASGYDFVLVNSSTTRLGGEKRVLPLPSSFGGTSNK